MRLKVNIKAGRIHRRARFLWATQKGSSNEHHYIHRRYGGARVDLEFRSASLAHNRDTREERNFILGLFADSRRLFALDDLWRAKDGLAADCAERHMPRYGCIHFDDESSSAEKNGKGCGCDRSA
jgi:hypothetical protein